MLMKSAFGEYLDKKHREARKQLGIIKEVLQKGGMRVSDNRDSEDGGEPYIYLYNPNSDASFKGIRIYKIGEKVAFRIQREEKTYPYGKAYGLDLQKLFTDLVSDDMKESVAGKLVIETIVKEMKRFFSESQKAEDDLATKGISGTGDPLGKVLIQSTGMDVSSTMPQAQ
jgi:hypothetical protein